MERISANFALHCCSAGVPTGETWPLDDEALGGSLQRPSTVSPPRRALAGTPALQKRRTLHEGPGLILVGNAKFEYSVPRTKVEHLPHASVDTP